MNEQVSGYVDDPIILPAENVETVNVTFESPMVEPNSMDQGFDSVMNNNAIIQPVNGMNGINGMNGANNFRMISGGENCPVANYYVRINWEGGFERWNLVRFSTPMDGNCLFHAITNSFFAPYHTETLHGKTIQRNRIVRRLREELSIKLGSRISSDSSSLTHYDTLNGGNTAIFAEHVPEFKLQHMQNELNSNTAIGYGYMEFIGNILDKDIYILEAVRCEIYFTDELPLTIKGNRNSIVLYYANGHYELMGIQNQDGSFTTHFVHTHTLIQFLYNRVLQIINQQRQNLPQ